VIINDTVMKNTRILFVYIGLAICLALVCSLYTWGSFSIINGTMNGKEWTIECKFIFCFLSLAVYAYCVGAAIWFWNEDAN
jgi:hypothetical protein